MHRSDIDAFGIEQTAEGPPYCRVLVTATNECQRDMKYMVPIDGVTSDVKKVLIHCTREQTQGENEFNCKDCSNLSFNLIQCMMKLLIIATQI